MADFFQNGIITTLHRLNQNGLDRLEQELEKFSAENPIGLVLPALYSEFQTPAMHRIRDELANVRYLRHIVLSLGGADRAQFEEVKQFFSGVSQPITILWIDGERFQNLLGQLEQYGLSAGPNGKGRSCWLAYGYLLATSECDIIALHDCDILNYDRRMLARLCYPIANPTFGFEFCKGYYARVTNRMHGRVTRLFLTPLVRAMRGMEPRARFLEFLDGFRYALAGEFAMKASLARINRVPCDWGLEVGVLAEVFRNRAVSRVCQVDLADNYEHKHQPLSVQDPTKGLRRMAIEIAKSLFRTMAGDGVVLTADHFRSLQVRYVRLAEDAVSQYYADAMVNGFDFDRNAEEEAVAAFAKSLRQAAQEFLDDPLGAPLIPNWNRVLSAIPEFFELMKDAVREDAGVLSECAA